MAEKKCTKCGEFKPLDSFHKQKDCSGGRRPDCKACFYVAGKARLTPEKDREYKRRWRAANPTSDREYYSANKPRLIAQMKEYNLRNREAYNERLRRWRKNNPAKVQVWVRNRRAKLKGLRGAHSIQDIISLMESQRGKCIYCLCNISKKFQVDHIVPVSASGTNDKANLQLLCKTCNLDKRAKDPLEFQKGRGMLL